ncbi:hypothetical protein ACA910_016202 [Epithemia clementina (nom. ined.)]
MVDKFCPQTSQIGAGIAEMQHNADGNAVLNVNESEEVQDQDETTMPLLNQQQNDVFCRFQEQWQCVNNAMLGITGTAANAESEENIRKQLKSDCTAAYCDFVCYCTREMNN